MAHPTPVLPPPSRPAAPPQLQDAAGLPAISARDGRASADFRQLRHQTKNALQRLLCEVWRSAEAQGSAENRRVFEDLQRRLCLSAAVSDALFGFTDEPGPLAERLRGLCAGLLGLLGQGDQLIHLDVRTEGACPEALAETVLRVAHEMVGNAIKHGMHARLLGRIGVHLSSGARRTRLVVSDDGWGFGTISGQGQGLPLMQELAGRHAGHVLLRRRGDRTYAELDLPH